MSRRSIGLPTRIVPLLGTSTAGAMPRILSFFTVIAALALWHRQTVGDLPLDAVVIFCGLVATWALYGSAIRRLTRTLVPSGGAAFDLLTGFFAVSTLLLLLTLLTPLGMSWRIGVVVVGGLLIAWPWNKPLPDPGARANEWASLVVVAVCAVAATVWTHDMRPLTQVNGDNTIFRAWQDLFVHARQISIFALSHGRSTIQDMRSVGEAAPIYHVASYMTPAAVSVLTGAAAIGTVGSVQLPLGIVLTGLAAFVLARALFGIWPAAVAAIVVVTMPDPYQLGMGVRMLGYHFMSQVNLGTLYGIACACVAWLFVFEGCRRNRLLDVACGYALLVVCLTYKAHIFVANALVLLLYPCVFFHGVRARWRLVTGVVFFTVFVGAILVSQRFDRVPLIRLDGSGLMPYVYQLVGGSDPGTLSNWFRRVLTIDRHAWWIAGSAAALQIALATFGPWLVATPVVLWRARRRLELAVLVFPFVVAGNYLLMALGLAIDDRAIGAPEELLNRPFAWAYFIVVVWTVAVACRLLLGTALPRSRPAVAALGAMAVLLVGAVVVESRNLQTYPAWSVVEYADAGSVPTCYVRAGEFIRAHARPGDVVQDQDGDPKLVLAAVSERQAYASIASFGGASPLRSARQSELATFDPSADGAATLRFMQGHGIDWFVVHSRQDTAGTPAPRQPDAFGCSGYRVLHVSR